MSRSFASIKQPPATRPPAERLYQIIVISAALLIIHIPLLLIILDNAFVPLVLDGGLLIALALAAALAYLHQIRMARAVLIWGVWGYITVGSVLLDGIENPIVGTYMIFVLMVALLYNARRALYALTFSLVSILLIFIAETKVWLPPSAITLPPAYIWLEVVGTTITMALLIYLLLDVIQKTTHTSLQHLQAVTRQREQNLAALHNVTIELTRCDTLDDLFRRAIELSRSKLGLDRVGVFLIDADTQNLVGTYGTDMQGNLRDETYLVKPLVEAIDIVDTLASAQHINVEEDVDLIDNWEVVGHGWRIVALLIDGDTIVGWLSTDNLISQVPLEQPTIDLVTLFTATLTQLIVRKQAEENLRQSQQALQTKSESLSTINKMAALLHHTHDMEGVLSSTSEALTSLLNANSVLVYVLDVPENRLRLIHQKDSLVTTPEYLSLDKSLSGYVVTHGTVVISEDFTEDDRLSANARAELAKSPLQFMVFIPIVSGDEVLGVIVLGFTNPIRPVTSDYQTYTAIGQTVGLALANIRFINEIQIEKAFSDSIIESFPNIFYMFSEAGQILRWNANLETVLGYDGATLQTISPHNLVMESDRASIDSLIQKTIASGSGSAYLHLTTRSQEEVPYIFSTRRYALNGTHYIIGTGVDLSDRMQLLEQLQYQTTQLHTAGDISKSIITVLDARELMQYSVDLVCERFGFYYVGLFMSDKDNEYALLSAGSGEAGQQMLGVNYRLPIDHNSMIGRCIMTATAVIASDVEIETQRYVNPYLPQTRSEMALPLMNRGLCLGAMTIQSTRVDAFTSDDIAVIRFIADHLASAVINARLYEIINRRQRYLGILRHVTQRAMPERNLEIFMQTIVEALSQEFRYTFAAIFLADYEDEMLDLAAAADREKKDMTGIRWSFHEGILGWVIRNQQAYLCRDSSKDPLYRTRAHDQSVPRSIVITPIWQVGAVIGLLAVNKNEPNSLDELDLEIMTELGSELGLHMENIQLYAQTRQNAADLEQRVEFRTSQLQTVNRELESFAYSVSHDLRAPLRSIDGFSQVLMEDYYAALDDGGKHYLSRIRASTQRMGQLIDDLLTLSRVTRREFKQQQIDLSEMAKEIIDLFQSHDPEREVDIVIQSGVVMYGDARMLRIVLENLLGNAWKFTKTTAKARIEFACQKQDDTIIYSVRDNGVGFNMQYADKLFKAFQRLHGMNEFEGTGIGLATVKRVVDRHGGRIWVDANVDHGATFYFTIGNILNHEAD